MICLPFSWQKRRHRLASSSNWFFFFKGLPFFGCCKECQIKFQFTGNWLNTKLFIFVIVVSDPQRCINFHKFQKIMFLVFKWPNHCCIFEQCLGAAHSKCWSKHVSVVFLCINAEKGRKSKTKLEDICVTGFFIIAISLVWSLVRDIYFNPRQAKNVKSYIFYSAHLCGLYLK